MSFLSELRTKRHCLKPTTTTVTYVDGRKFMVSDSNECVEIGKTQFGFVIDTKPDNCPAKIIDHLFLGSQDCCDPDILRNFKIENVLSIGTEAMTKCDDVTYEFVPCLDLPETNLHDVLDRSVGFIRNAVQKQSNILVHCNAGVSRSASVVIAYLILILGFDYVNAYLLVKNARQCIKPNDGFVKQLKALDSK